MSSLFPEVISTRINGRKITRMIMRDWIIVRTVRPDYPNVIWVQWIAKKAERSNLAITPPDVTADKASSG